MIPVTSFKDYGLHVGGAMCALFQLAHFKAHGEIPRLVETIDMSHFQRGRVAWVVANTSQAAKFVRYSMSSSLPLHKDAKALQLLQEASNAYRDLISSAVSGNVMPQIGELVR